MGREIKRVPLDFAWPRDTTWGGYINPFTNQSTQCPHCAGHGSSPEARRLTDQWYGNAPFRPEDRGSKPWKPEDAPVREFAERNCRGNPVFYGSSESAVVTEARRMCALWNAAWCHHLNADDVAALLAENRLWDFTRTPRTDAQREIVRQKRAGGGNSWLPENNGYIPTPEEVNEWSLRGLGHDSCNQWICVRAECKRLGVPNKCAHCDGEGSIWPTHEIKQLAEDWKDVEPPIGDGYQLWETVTEGSPISPVFATPEALADWLATSSDYKWRQNDEGVTRDQWLKFINGPGWAPSVMAVGGQFLNGVEGMLQ